MNLKSPPSIPIKLCFLSLIPVTLCYSQCLVAFYAIKVFETNFYGKIQVSGLYH